MINSAQTAEINFKHKGVIYLLTATFFKGVITGLILSFPFGPVGFYCMEKTLTEGKKEGYTTALGMITSDVIYGLVAFLFVNFVDDFIFKYETLCKIAVGVLLILLGVKKLKSPVLLDKKIEHGYNFIQNYFVGFGLASINITGILTILGIYTLLGIVRDQDNYLYLALGIASGGVTSWFFTVNIICFFRKFITDDLLIKLSRIASFIIMTFGIITLGYIIFS